MQQPRVGQSLNGESEDMGAEQREGLGCSGKGVGREGLRAALRNAQERVSMQLG